jgi:hypothetical protein
MRPRAILLDIFSFIVAIKIDRRPILSFFGPHDIESVVDETEEI